MQHSFTLLVFVLICTHVGSQGIQVVSDSCQLVDVNNLCVKCKPNYTLIPRLYICVLTQDFLGVQAQPAQTSFQSFQNVIVDNQPEIKITQIPTSVTQIITIGNSQQNIVQGTSVSQENVGVQVIQENDLNCKQKNQDGSCALCYPGFYYSGVQMRCMPANPNCKSSDKFGKCLSCYDGYILNNGNCIKLTISANPAQSIELVVDQKSGNPNCFRIQDNVCQQCSYRFVFDENGICVAIDPTCATWNEQGDCATCYPGYQPAGKQCVQIQQIQTDQFSVNVIQVSANLDRNCFKYDDNKNCIECAYKYVFDQNGICKQVNPDCATWNTQGHCTSCYSGFLLAEVTCLKVQITESVSGSASHKDPNCFKFENNKCVQCSFQYFFNDQGLCIQISPLCRTWNGMTGQCTGCFEGYVLSGSTCAKIQQISVSFNTNLDPNCFEYEGLICKKCAERYFFNDQNICTAVSPTCKQWNQRGACTLCYEGHELKSGNCIEIQIKAPEKVSSQQTQFTYFIPYADQKKCQQYENSICVSCQHRSVLIQNRCYVVSDHCQSWNEQAYCDSCFGGYYLDKGSCLIGKIVQITQQVAVQQTSANPNCLEWEDNICKQCSYRHIMNQQGYCSKISDLCKTWDQKTGLCNSCYDGYFLRKGVCYIPDQNCDLHHSDFGCVKCKPRYFLGFNKLCEPADPLCEDFDILSGECFKCYQNYTLRGERCVVA